MLEISEIFRSIQGESTFAGIPCVFIRLTGCNLHCRYCDTRYARGAGREMTVDEVLSQVQSFPAGLIEVTGGEPLLQDDTPILLDALAARQWTVLVETNGSIELPATRNYRAIMDMKCPSSGEADSFCSSNAERLGDGDELKFVVADHEDFHWSLMQIERFDFSSRKLPLLFSPVWGVCDPADLADWILHSARQDLRLQLQLQKILWPDTIRGR